MAPRMMLAVDRCARDGTDPEPTLCELHFGADPTGLPGLAELLRSAKVPGDDVVRAALPCDAGTAAAAAVAD